MRQQPWGQHQRASNAIDHPEDYEGYQNALPGTGYARPATLTPELVRQIMRQELRQILREELERALRGKR